MVVAANGAEWIMELRAPDARDTDAIIALIDRVYREYGDAVCLANADGDLLDIPGKYGRGNFAVLDHEGAIVGTIAVLPRGGTPPIVELKRLYLDPPMRGTGAAGQLVDWAFARARALGAERVEFWSDTRFTRAHRFYEKLGFSQTGAVRTLDDAWEPYSEFQYSVDLDRAPAP